MLIGKTSQKTTTEASELFPQQLATHESRDPVQSPQYNEAEESTSLLSSFQNVVRTEDSQQVTVQRLINSSLSLGELSKYYFQLPLDPQVLNELISQPKTLMEDLCKVPVENKTLEIDWKNAVLQEEGAYGEFLAFLLFRLNYAYFKFEESQDEVIEVISELLGPSGRLFNQKMAKNAESLRMRLIFLSNMTQGLLEAKGELVLDILPTVFTVTRIFAPFTDKTEMIIEFMGQKFKEIVNSELFLNGVERYLHVFEHKIEAVDAIQACKTLNFTLFGVKGLTRILGMLIPHGVALNLRHYLCPENLEPRKTQYLVSLIHLLGQFIAKKFSLKMKNEIAPEEEGDLFRDENHGYLFQFFIFGGLKKWWRDSSCRKKLINVLEWPRVLPLFTKDESAKVQNQKVFPTCNSSMLLTYPIHVGLGCC